MLLQAPWLFQGQQSVFLVCSRIQNIHRMIKYNTKSASQWPQRNAVSRHSKRALHRDTTSTYSPPWRFPIFASCFGVCFPLKPDGKTKGIITVSTEDNWIQDLQMTNGQAEAPSDTLTWPRPHRPRQQNQYWAPCPPSLPRHHTSFLVAVTQQKPKYK